MKKLREMFFEAGLEYRKHALHLTLIQTRNVVLYGSSYRKTYAYALRNLQIKVLEFKANFLIELSKIKNQK